MFEPIELRLQWPPRRDEIDVCSERLLRTFTCLAAASPAFARWAKFPGSATQAGRVQPIDVNDRNTLADLLLKGRNRYDAPPRDPIVNLGFTANFWNMDAMERYASLYVQIGSYAERVGTNNVQLSIRQVDPPLLKPEQYIALLKQLIDIWDPNLGLIYQKPPRPAGVLEKRNFLAHYTIQGREYNEAAWPKAGKVAELYNSGELRIDSDVKKMFAEGKFPEPKTTLVGKILRKLT